MAMPSPPPSETVQSRTHRTLLAIGLIRQQQKQLSARAATLHEQHQLIQAAARRPGTDEETRRRLLDTERAIRDELEQMLSTMQAGTRAMEQIGKEQSAPAPQNRTPAPSVPRPGKASRRHYI